MFGNWRFSAVKFYVGPFQVQIGLPIKFSFRTRKTEQNRLKL